MWEASPLGEGFPPLGRRAGSPPTREGHAGEGVTHERIPCGACVIINRAGLQAGDVVMEVDGRKVRGATGLREGDVILSVNRRDVTRLEDLAAAAEAGRGGLLLNVQRGTSAFFLMLQ